MPVKPHVSEAIARLRFWISAAGLLVAIAAIVQVFVFGLVHYTDVRWNHLEPAQSDTPLEVVSTDGHTTASRSATPDHRTGRGSPDSGQSAKTPAETNDVRSSVDVVLERTVNLGASVGTIATVTMMLLVGMGVVIAGGGQVPGVHKAVTAGTWSIVLAMLCIPLRDVLPTVPIPGVFVNYQAMTGASDAASASGASGLVILSQYVLIPLMSAACAGYVVMCFRAGVEQGVIVTSVSELDEALDREMSAIRRRGVAAGSAPRAIGALNRALGDRDTDPPLQAAAGAESMSRSNGEADSNRDFSQRKAHPGDPLSRPI